MTQEERVLLLREATKRMDDKFFEEKRKLESAGTCTHSSTSVHTYRSPLGGEQYGDICNACHKVRKVGEWW